MKFNLPVSLIIPTKNSELYLEKCLTSIKKQTYKNLEIIVVDGKSTDATLEIAKKYGAKIFRNDLILAEPGVALGINKAKGDVCTILAADNYLGSVDWIEKMIKPFIDTQIVLSYTRQCSPHNNSFWINRYMNVFTDPFNHFVYGYAANTRTYSKAYKIKESKEGYTVFDFTPQNHPILALAQGTTLRKSYKRPNEKNYDDISPVIDMIEKGYKMAYVPQAQLMHDSIRSVSQYVRKQRWAVDNALSVKTYGFMSRYKYNNTLRKIKTIVFLPYALSFILPLFRAAIHYIIDGEREWFFHPFINWVTGFIIVGETFKIKVLKRSYEYKNR